MDFAPASQPEPEPSPERQHNGRTPAAHGTIPAEPQPEPSPGRRSVKVNPAAEPEDEPLPQFADSSLESVDSVGSTDGIGGLIPPRSRVAFEGAVASGESPRRATSLKPPRTPSRSQRSVPQPQPQPQPQQQQQQQLPRTPSGLRIRTFSSGNLFGLTRVSSVPSFEDLEAYSEEHSVTAISAEFASAYLQARKLLRTGAVKFPVVRATSDGSIVDFGNVYQWKKGVAERVVSGELVCSVVTFVRNRNYDPADPNSALFTEHAIQGRAASSQSGSAASSESNSGGASGGGSGGDEGALLLVAAESSAQGVRRTMEDETVILMDLNKSLQEDPRVSTTQHSPPPV